MLVRNQVRIAPMGGVIGLDFAAVLETIKLYVPAEEVKDVFDYVRNCFEIEQEHNK